jgi:hypothetical protein
MKSNVKVLSLACASAAAMFLGTSVQASLIADQSAIMTGSYDLSSGPLVTVNTPSLQNDVYENTDNVPTTGQNTWTPGGAGTGKYSAEQFDDIQTTATAPFPLYQIAWSIVNTSSTAMTFTTGQYFSFYANDNGGSAPGTYLGYIGFNLSGAGKAAAHTGYTFSSLPITSTIVLPTSFWVGTFFTGTTSAVANEWGSFVSDPPTLGTSNDNLAFLSSSNALTTYNVSDPVGSDVTSTTLGAPANILFETNVPEASYAGLIAPVGMLLARRRRA